jgi:DNA repair photolyase
MPRFIEAKNILSTIKDSPYNIFGLKYNMNLYRGCQHGCIYCDSRSKCYQLGELSDIRIKENALVLLEKELKSKRVKGTIGFGSMNDPYMPVEKEYELTRNALILANRYRFPVHIITKSNLVTRDIDVLKKISNDYAAISITITAFDDNMSREIEPGAPLSSQRFDAIKELSDAGIYTGITLMPILPYITDTSENIKSLIMKAKECGAKYILAFMGMTIREGQREYFYKELDKRFPGLKEKYISSFGERYGCDSPEIRKLNDLYLTLCNTLDIKTKMEFYKPPVIKQLELFKNL